MFITANALYRSGAPAWSAWSGRNGAKSQSTEVALHAAGRSSDERSLSQVTRVS